VRVLEAEVERSQTRIELLSREEASIRYADMLKYTDVC
jgi:hypothetical protein